MRARRVRPAGDRRLWRAGWLLVACAFVTAASTQSTPPPGPFEEAAFDQPRPAHDDALPPQARRGTGVVGRLSAGALGAVRLGFTLPDGRRLEARRQQIIDDVPGEYRAWVGTFDTQPGSLVVLGTHRGTTAGFLSYGAEMWEILPTADGQLVLYRFDDARLPNAEPTVTASRPGGAYSSPSAGFGAAEPTPAQLERGYVHDLLVVHTPAARERYGRGPLEVMIRNAVAAANQAYRNSGVKIELRLAAVRELPYRERGDMRGALRDLQSAGDGELDEVHALRDALGADIVTLVAENTDSCGIAWSMRGESASAAGTAFNVVNAGCLSNQSLAHEVGHNQGNMHDRDSTANTGAYGFSFGYRRCTADGQGFRTIMAYACGGVARVARFSSPSLDYQGQPMGVAWETDPDDSADNVRSMNATADTVAAFRHVPGLRTVRAPQRLNAWPIAPGAVAVHWFDASDIEAGYTVERSSNGIEFEQVATLGADATRYVDNDAGSAPRWYYRVRGYNSRGNGPFSEVRAVAMW
jgi:hypothetical protein